MRFITSETEVYVEMYRKMVLCGIVLCVLITSVFLLHNRNEGFEYDQFVFNKVQIQVNLSKAQQISELYNSYDVYKDLQVENYCDLVNESQLIISITVEKLVQDNDAVFTTANVDQVIKDDSKKISKNDTVVFLQPNVIMPNVYSSNGSYIIDIEKPLFLKLESPCMTTEIGNRYIVYLNPIASYNGKYRMSTILYSIVPIKESISIKEISSDKTSQSIIDLSCTDYVAVINEADSLFVEEEYQDLYKKAQMLAKDYVNRYKEICNETLKQYGLKPFSDN